MLIGGRAYLPPYEHAWLDAKLDHRARFELRGHLRDLVNVTDARLVFLWAMDPDLKSTVVESAGDTVVMPPTARIPHLSLTVPSRDTVADESDERHDAVTLRISMGNGVPRLGLAIVGAERAASPVLFDAIDATARHVEAVVVRTLERAEKRDRRASRETTRRRMWPGEPPM